MTIAQVTLLDGKVIPLKFDYRALREFNKLTGQSPAEFLRQFDLEKEEDATKVLDFDKAYAGIYCNLARKSIYRKGSKLDDQLDPKCLDEYMAQILKGMIYAITGEDIEDAIKQARQESSSQEDSSEGEVQAPSTGAS